MKVIIHADDLGKNEAVNEAIFTLMDEGKITSASILANGPAFENAVRGSRYFPQCSFGVHLNLSQFEPLRPSPAFAPLLLNGEFQPSPRLRTVSVALRNAIIVEWSAQVQRLRDAGIEPTHIDSHHHAHTRFSLRSALDELCREHRIHRVRLRHTFDRQPIAWRLDHRLYNSMLRGRYTCTDEFGPFAAFASVAPRLPVSSKVELMVHPGHPRYESETEILRSSINEDFLSRCECITHRELN